MKKAIYGLCATLAFGVAFVTLIQPNRETSTTPKAQVQENPDELFERARATLHTQPHEAWELLTRALEIDPTHKQAKLLQAETLEAAGEQELARTAYQELRRDHFQDEKIAYLYTNFLLRRGDFQSAWDLLAKTEETEYAPLGCQKITLSRLVKPIAGMRAETELPQKTQASFWTRLVNLLVNEREELALEQLKSHSYRRLSWNPELELSLLYTLNFRLNRTFQEDTAEEMAAMLTRSPSELSQPLTQELIDLAHLENQNPLFQVNRETKRLLLENEIFAALFAAAGFDEAALALHEQLPHSFPTWAKVALTRSIQNNRGPIEALQFVQSYERNEPLLLLEAELQMAVGMEKEGESLLLPFVANEGPHQKQAALILADGYLQARDFTSLSQLLSSHPELFQSVQGQEVHGKKALLENDLAAADAIYEPIADNSSEAKRYLARRAMSKKQWKKAKQLTAELLIEEPESARLRKDYQKILQQETE